MTNGSLTRKSVISALLSTARQRAFSLSDRYHHVNLGLSAFFDTFSILLTLF
ncbi:MAG: hypothetical protein ACI9CE_000736 [Flavobacterium sp.]|jgi:hypothetical protein